jgi:hypothetical protein
MKVLLSLWLAQASTKNADKLKMVIYVRIKCVEISNGETGGKSKHIAVV